MLDLSAHYDQEFIQVKPRIKHKCATNIGSINHMHKACAMLLTKELFEPSAHLQQKKHRIETST